MNRHLLLGIAVLFLLVFGCLGTQPSSNPQTNNDEIVPWAANEAQGPKNCRTEQIPYTEQECENVPYQEQVCNMVDYKSVKLCDSAPTKEGWLKDWTEYSCDIVNQESQGGTYEATVGCYFEGKQDFAIITKYIPAGDADEFVFKRQRTGAYNCFGQFTLPQKQVCAMVTKTRQSCRSVTRYRDETKCG